MPFAYGRAAASSNIVSWSDIDGSGEMMMPGAATTATEAHGHLLFS